MNSSKTDNVSIVNVAGVNLQDSHQHLTLWKSLVLLYHCCRKDNFIC